jgi:hypothetical protein
MAFFKSFPKTSYDFPNRKGTEIVDIFRAASTIDKGLDAAAAYQFYQISNQRPDQLSEELYGNTNYYWTFFIANVGLREGWPLSNISFEEYIAEKYNGFALILYRNDINFSEITGTEQPGDEPEYNSIAGKFEIGTIITGIGSDGGTTFDPIPASGVEAEVIGRSSDTNTLYLRYLEADTEFAEGEEFFARAPNNNTYNIFDKYFNVPWKDAPDYFVNIDGDRVDNVANNNTTRSYATLYDTEFLRNEERRNIRVIRKTYLEEFVVAYRKSLNGK